VDSQGWRLKRKEEFEARKNAWKKVEPALFPVFQGVKIKTEKGEALIVLANNIRVQVGQDSLFSFQEANQLHLLQGEVSFHMPSGTGMSFRVGHLSVGKPHRLQAAKSPMVSPTSEEAVGSITLHTNGAVTVKSFRGPLSVQDQYRVVLAALSRGESVTIPSVTTLGKEGIMIAQGDPTQRSETLETPPDESFWERLEPWQRWLLAALGLGASAAGVAALADSGGSSSGGFIPTSLP
jgi:hypothetical protein